ncbi:hypothetical protein L226DRAFT_538237 [Lentinus tigrinus ALCF2SS1-7]|uniref:uncharacterized protein n=1 Tax=Lentinus tigrinus ALCF2SS1-7 TaxID=1328758 RepID=UPI001165D38A|nr:hypothetical protein L226DRAFT_538237 [Lentinus tigrinus ALCF2SS1-7]
MCLSRTSPSGSKDHDGSSSALLSLSLSLSITHTSPSVVRFEHAHLSPVFSVSLVFHLPSLSPPLSSRASSPHYHPSPSTSISRKPAHAHAHAPAAVGASGSWNPVLPRLRSRSRS